MDMRRLRGGTFLLLVIFILAFYWSYHPPSTEPHSIRPNLGNDHVKRILFWTPWFGDQGWTHLMDGKKQKLFNCQHQCLFNTNDSDALGYDAVIFHGRDWVAPPEKRTPNQVYVMLIQEPPYLTGLFRGGNFYNWSVTYHSDSDIQMPYWTLRRKKKGTPSQALSGLPQMSYKRNSSEAMIAWVVSRCDAFSKRQQYVEFLKQFVKVDIYGMCGTPCEKIGKGARDDCFQNIANMGKYKFYLSFENSACSEYITEKAYHPLNVGLVPIVYGGFSKQDYISKLPKHSFIDVRDFANPKQLSDYLLYLDKNDTAYKAYFAWRTDYELLGYLHIARAMPCHLCDALHNKAMTVPRSINFSIFWNPARMCDRHILQKATSHVKNNYRYQHYGSVRKRLKG